MARPTAPEAYDGQGLSAVHLAITSEIFTGANHALQMIAGLVPGAIGTLLQYGTEDQQARFIPRLASGEMLATMCLTESAAGSDLARVRAKAQKSDEHWRISGEKIFISGGDQDISDDILHLVLARTSPDGLKGLSLFAVVGRVKVIRLEEKMGLHASPTCQLAFDGQRAELLGQEGAGLLSMFTLMNHARIDLALQGVAHASRATATAIARRCANVRVQGQVQGQDAYLVEHADVQRMIDRADSLAKSARAITNLALVTMERGDNAALVDFLTPLAKV